MPLQNFCLWITLLQIITGIYSYNYGLLIIATMIINFIAAPLCVDGGAGFNDTESCENFPEVANQSLTELQLQVNRYVN